MQPLVTMKLLSKQIYTVRSLIKIQESRFLRILHRKLSVYAGVNYEKKLSVSLTLLPSTSFPLLSLVYSYRVVYEAGLPMHFVHAVIEGLELGLCTYFLLERSCTYRAVRLIEDKGIPYTMLPPKI